MSIGYFIARLRLIPELIFDSFFFRVIIRQTMRSNQPAKTLAEYWGRSILIPYLDSIISSITERFSKAHLPAFSLFLRHPAKMMKYSVDEMITETEKSVSFYDFNPFSQYVPEILEIE